MRRRIVYLGVLFSVLLSGCTGEKAITAIGVGKLAVGDAFTSTMAVAQGWGMSVKDTLIEEGEYTWKALRLQGTQGFVLIEEDFSGLGLINRIRIEDPSFTLHGKHSVGQTWGSYRNWKSDWTAIRIPNYDFWDVQRTRKPYFHLLIPFNGEASLDQVSDSVRVAGIVIM